jgi:uncharacterized protein YkwD
MSARSLRPQFVPGLEPLDVRVLPTIHLAHGTLTIFGTGGPDQIHVVLSGNQIQIGSQSFAAESVQRIVVDAGDGDDTVTMAPEITAETWLFGRLGNDRLTGGGGINYLYGGEGNDVLIGGSGRNIIVGGSGHNSIQANPGDEVTTGQPIVRRMPTPIAQQILDLVNQQRQSFGLAALAWNDGLTFAAEVHSHNMASMASLVGPSQAMTHLLVGANAPTLGSRADLAGYDYRALGENVAYGFATASAVVDAWMNSSGHRANILSPNFTQIGIAVAYSAQGLPYYTQFFGSPDQPATQTFSGHNSPFTPVPNDGQQASQPPVSLPAPDINTVSSANRVAASVTTPRRRTALSISDLPSTPLAGTDVRPPTLPQPAALSSRSVTRDNTSPWTQSVTSHGSVTSLQNVKNGFRPVPFVPQFQLLSNSRAPDGLQRSTTSAGSSSNAMTDARRFVYRFARFSSNTIITVVSS